MPLEVRRESAAGGSMSNTKLAVLLWLTLQNSIHTLLIRYSRARAVEEMFYSSVAVFLMEVVKIAMCTFMVLHESLGISR